MEMASPTALFPQPDGMFFAVLPFLIVFSGMVLSYREVSGSNLGYSKFAGDNSKQLRVPSKAGMFLLYFPSALVAGAPLLYWYGLLPALPEGLKSCGASGLASLLEKAGAASDERLWLLVVTVFAHFTKRDLECLFVHKFSGYTNLGSLIFISGAYATITGVLIMMQVLSTGLAAPSLDLKWVGFAIYLVGVLGNGYHHWLLARLRKEGDKKYVVPQGGLFGVLVCPHYVFEIITFAGIAFMCQTVVGWSVLSLVFLYLTGRSITSKQWYFKKVDGFPRERSVLIPGVF
ncbi:hypothetical protein M758_UG180800 [Ceratodon purpureus]|nr:hypothetical protein M758_UG180800 [Ceratodon purpureus]